jgi:hypothetical protein
MKPGWNTDMHQKESGRTEPVALARTAQLLRQYLYFCTSKASKLSTCDPVWGYWGDVSVEVSGCQKLGQKKTNRRAQRVH